MPAMSLDPLPVLVTGATGYIGGRLVPRLLAAGRPVRCLVRDARKLAERDWAADPRLAVVEGDARDPERLAAAMDGCEAAYYLIHSMITAGPEYVKQDREIAEGFASAAARAGLSRIIYLGGLGERGRGLSTHLASRCEVEDVLRSGSVPVTALRAAMIIGSGSASFEILRYLVERLPVMVTHRWVSTPAQPIAVRDALHYLIACLSEPRTTGRILDIGGPDVLTYREIIRIMAEVLELPPRRILPVPVLTPRLSSLWIHLVTPLSASIARPLAEGLRNPVVCRDDLAHRLMPHDRLSVRDAVSLAVGRMRAGAAETSWLDAGPVPGDPDWAGGRAAFEDRREIDVAAPPPAVFRVACGVGGARGWYSSTALWKLRGLLDRLFGGPGLARGRRHPDRVRYGDVLDFWRVSDVVPDRALELRAEMRLPGEAVLRFDVAPHPEGARSRLVQTALFRPRGLAGILYWFAILPLHGIVFRGMLHGLAAEAERIAARSDARP
jgi:uncharacterized protein YbjT (DUF2867 family)